MNEPNKMHLTCLCASVCLYVWWIQGLDMPWGNKMGPARGNVDQGLDKVADNTNEQNTWIKPNQYNKKNLNNNNNNDRNSRNQRTTNQNTDEPAVGQVNTE
jgi:hypothetical protein